MTLRCRSAWRGSDLVERHRGKIDGGPGVARAHLHLLLTQHELLVLAGRDCAVSFAKGDPDFGARARHERHFAHAGGSRVLIDGGPGAGLHLETAGRKRDDRLRRRIGGQIDRDAVDGEKLRQKNLPGAVVELEIIGDIAG